MSLRERTIEQYRDDATALRARHNHNAANALEERAAELARGEQSVMGRAG